MAIYSDSGFITARDTPLIRPTLDLNFAREKRLDSRVTFTRASSATYVDEYGVIRTAANNVPRFDHDPATGESLGLLIEESRTNLRTNSENFLLWGSGGDRVTIINNTITAPDGNLTGNSFIEQANTKSWRWTEWGQSCTSGTAYTVSCFVKPGTGTFGVLYFFADNSVFTAAATSFDLSGNGSVSVLGSSTTAKITPYPNGWYRISATQTAINSSTGYFAIGFSYSSNFTLTPTGSPSNTLGYVWGAQVEAGSFPTSYIPTSGATATRSADLASITGTNFSEIYNPLEGTLYLEAVGNGIGNTSSNATFQVDNGSSSNRITVINDDTNTVNSLITVNGTQTSFSVSPSFTSGPNKNIITYKSGDIATSLNGSVVVTSSSIITLPVVNRFRLGSNANGNSNNTIKRATYFPKRLSNDQLQALTS